MTKKWKSNPISEKQASLIQKLSAERDYSPPDLTTLTAGEASDLIDYLFKMPRKPAAAVAVLDFAPIAALFARAGKTLRWPKIRLQTASGLEVTTSVAGERAKFPGSINVLGEQNPQDGQRPFFGRIHKDGSYEERPGIDAGVRELLARFSADPEGVAAEYGKLTGNCCFCGRNLSDDRSTDVGYGPVCAQSFGLAWGNRQRPVDLQQLALV